MNKSSAPPPNRPSRFRPELKIALAYAFFGALWIFFSDWALEAVLRDPARINAAQTYKGWAFVAATAGLLYLFVRREVSRRRVSETALMANTQSIARIGGWEVDADTGALYWTNETYRIHETSPEEYTPSVETAIAFYAPESVPVITTAVNAALQTGQPFDLELELITAKQRRLWVRSVSQAHKENGRVRKIFGSFQDITKQKQAGEEIRKLNTELEQRVLQRTGQLEAANKELEFFSYSVSHDLRAPLRHIAGFSNLLLARPAVAEDPSARRHADIIAAAARKMGLLIDDLLVFSRTGQAVMRQTRFPMMAVVEDTRGELQPDLEGRCVAWHVGPMPEVVADRAMLRLVWLNLLDNALKYTRLRPEARLEVGCQESGQETVFFVRDNGVGFDMKYAGKLFGVFQRLHRDEEFEGTGIGLANVQRIIHRHGGRTWAEGRLDEGAVFYFSLPRNLEGLQP